MTVITRFAPSPTGRLHLGNLRAALINWLHARANGGRLLLRIDDTDAARSEERFVAAIRDDLAWLGIDTAEEVRQSARFDRYEACFAQLVAAGRVYPAYETPEELDLRRKVLLGRGLPPVYDRAALRLSEADRAGLEAEGRRPHWRFRLDHDAPIGWHDLVRGEQRFDAARLSDPVVRRADGSWLYLLPSVIDDIDLGVTTVIRGEDHVSNTATQIQMFGSLGAALPEFAHVALLTGAEGKLSKRLGATGVDEFRALGIEPEAVVAMLARLGTSDPVEPILDRAPLIEGFDFARFGRAPARFDEADLQALNARIVHQLDWNHVADRLPEGMDRTGWDAIRANLSTVAEAADWWRVVTGPVPAPALADEDRGFVRQAASVAESLDWDAGVWGTLTAALKQASGRKGRSLFLPLRLALTGRDHGPDMAALLPLIGREPALERLRAAG
ncbi:glutamate--tRNA ligase [Sphingomonas sp. ac-8]|uniref:glutamate--tRNA ligase n=1 Tax=Sphingomonas sp. ac-8 TaxID=3242977 RepID=UPI003A7FE247